MRRRLVATAVALATFLGAGGVAYAAFSARSRNPQAVSAGTLALSTDGAGAAVFSLSNLKPSTGAVSRCVAVTQTGPQSTGVRLYGTTSGALAQYLDVTVTRGTQSGAPTAACNGFGADATGVMFSGKLDAYPSSWSAGVVDPATWTNGETHSYRVTAQLPSSAAASAQGLSASATFTWEAR